MDNVQDNLKIQINTKEENLIKTIKILQIQVLIITKENSA